MRPKLTNEIIRDNGDYLEIDVSTAKHNGKVMLIEKEDYDRMKEEGYGKFYVVYASRKFRVMVTRSRKTLTIGKAIFGSDTGQISYKDGDCLNNRRSNLRCRKRGILDNRITGDYGDWVELDISTRTHPNATAKLDRIDYDMLVSLGCGRLSPRDPNGSVYVVTTLYGKSEMVHRVLIPDSVCIDHINHDTTDNRRKNIRSCTVQENNRNLSIRKDNTSGVTGVNYIHKTGKWIAFINIDGKSKYLGVFDDREEAVRIRREAELELFGEFAPR